MDSILLTGIALSLVVAVPAAAQVQRHDGFADHGIAAPTAITRGATATVNAPPPGRMYR